MVGGSDRGTVVFAVGAGDGILNKVYLKLLDRAVMQFFDRSLIYGPGKPGRVIFTFYI